MKNEELEKLRKYNTWRKFVSDLKIWTPVLEEACKIAEKQGYDRAIKDQSDILTQYKEALRELVELAPAVIDPSVAETYFEALEFRRKFILASEKAKQLLTDKK